MDKTIFVRTSKGEDEMRNKTALLSVDVKRALLMVDGVSTIREISKRIAPSLRLSLGQILKELLSNGYIEKKIIVAPPVKIIPQIKTTAPLKVTMPTKISVPALKAVDDGVNELDFATEFNSQVEKMSATEPHNEEIAVQEKAAEEARFRAEIKARVEAEFGDEIKARVEAELRAEALAREEAEAKKRMLDEAKAIEEARALAEVRARAEAKAQAEAKARAEAEAVVAAKLRIEAERRAEQLAREEAATKKRLQEEARAMAEAKAKQEAEIKAKQEAEAKARAEALAKERARAEAEAIAEEKARIEAEIRAQARARIEAETKKRMMEEARALAEAQAKHEAEAKALAAAKARAEAEVKAIAEAKARAEAEVKAIAESKARVEAEIRAEAKARIEAEINARKELELAGLNARFAAENSQLQKDQLAIEVREKLIRLANDEDMRKKSQQSGGSVAQAKFGANQDDVLSEAVKARSVDRPTSATVLFFDMVGYTKLSVNKQIEVKGQFNRLVSDCLLAQGDGERLILDTGDGAAIGFMQHPEDALQVAMKFRKALIANQHNDYPELKVRIGIHMGPVNVVKDMNGQSNMVGDGINDAQRVMNFAGTDQIFVSRAYYDFISRLSDSYADIFYYQGSQKDKHAREHHVYKLVDVVSPASENDQSNTSGAEGSVKLEPFSFEEGDGEIPLVKSEQKTKPEKLESATQQPESPINNMDAIASRETSKPAVAKSLRSEDEIKNLENEQAKLWAEAAQNSIETAKKNTLRIVQPQSEKSHPVRHVSNVRVKRERMPWGKMIAGLFLVLLVTLLLAPYVFPMRGFIPKIEQLLTEKFQQPVHIGGLAGRLLPTPRLDLIDVSVGEAKQINAQHARANFSVLTLFSDRKSIESLELENAQIEGTALQDVSVWLQKAAADKEYPIAHILLSDNKLEANGLQLFGIGGELNFNNAGDFSSAKLYANGHKLFLDMDVISGDKTKVSISARASALPLLPNWVFDDFNAVGEMTNSTLVISEIESHISAGIVRGNARLDWHSGWSAEGNLSAKAISVQNISGTITGEAEGTARFKMRSADMSKLADTATMDGSLVMNQGIINGIDIVETATRHRTENLPGGRTHFDELWSDFSFANGAYNFHQLKIKTGAVITKGAVDINKQQLSGRVTADLALRSDRMGLVPLQIGGSIDNPTLWAVH